MSGIDNQRRDYKVHKTTHKHQVWLMSSAGMPPASGWRRLRTKSLLHIGASLRRARPGPDRRRLHVGGMRAVVAGGPFGRTRFGLGGGRSRCSLHPSRALRVVRVARAFVSGHPGPNAVGRPRRGWPLAVVSESYPSGESGHTGRCQLGRPSHAGWPSNESPWSKSPARRPRVAWAVVARSVRAALRTATAPKQCGRFAGPPVSNSRRRRCRQFQVRGRARSESLHSRVFGLLALRRVGSWRRGLPGGALAGLAWSARRVPRPSRGLDYVSRASRRYPWRLAGRQSRRPLACSTTARRPSVAPAASTPIHAARRMSAAPAVSARGGSQAFSRAIG